MAPSSAISVLRFGAGGMALAVAAEDVITVAFPRPGVPHIGAVLGLDADMADMGPAREGREGGEPAAPSVPDTGTWPGSRTSGQRVIYVQDRGADSSGEAVFLADPPVEVLPCQAGDILPVAPGIPCLQRRPVMGFARIDDHMILLLDIPGIVQALAEYKEREEH